MTLQLVTFIYDMFLYAKCYVIHIVLDRIKIKSNQTLEVDNVIRKVFCNSVESFTSNIEQCRRNAYRSPVYEICKSCEKFGLLNMVISILKGDTPIPSKRKWSELVWRKGWELDDNYRSAINIMNNKT